MMVAYDKYGIENYLVIDETFNDSTEKITKFADMVETLPWKPYFSGFIRADLLISRKRDREELLRMGFLGQFHGIETFNDKSARYIDKGMKRERMQDGLVEVKNYFKQHVGKRYRANISLIAGLPHETLESLAQTRDWIRKNWMDQVTCAGPLEIAQKSDLRASVLSKDYEALGYEVMPDVTLGDLAPRNFEGSNFNKDEILMSQTGTHNAIAWKNKEMDIFQAWEWALSVDNLYKVGGRDFAKMEGYMLSKCVCDDNGIPLSVDKKLSLVNDTAAPYYSNFLTFVKNYKTKKLNYAK
jgi:hypothetical protein